MAYFEYSDVKISADPANTPDFYAAIEAYFMMHITAIDPDMGDPNGKLAKHTTATIRRLYSEVFPNMISELKKRAQENGESLRRSSVTGVYASRLFALEDYSQAIAINYGLLEAPKVQTPPAQTPQQPQAVPSLPMPGME